MWPQFAPETLDDVLEPLKNAKVNYWTSKKGMEFEGMFAECEGAKMAITCTNGTAALQIALLSHLPLLTFTVIGMIIHDRKKNKSAESN